MELKEKLDEFLMNDELYTIIINGNWGVGKTYQVDKWKDEFTNSQNEQLHKLSKKEKKDLKQYFFSN